MSGSWLIAGVCISVAAAVACMWLALCLLFWQGSWQLLYHPASSLARTPAGQGLKFDLVGLAANPAGEARLSGWWIPAAPGARYSRFTVLLLHGQTGNLADAVDRLAELHGLGVNILAIDYRGYGQSPFVRPSEQRWRQDADWALEYLTATRHVPAGAIVLDGLQLGANLAVEVAATHPELAGVVLEQPIDDPTAAIFRDGRARLVPAHLLVQDRWDLGAAAGALRIPSLWLVPVSPSGSSASDPGYDRVTAPKTRVWTTGGEGRQASLADPFGRWLDGLAGATGSR